MARWTSLSRIVSALGMVVVLLAPRPRCAHDGLTARLAETLWRGTPGRIAAALAGIGLRRRAGGPREAAAAPGPPADHAPDIRPSAHRRTRPTGELALIAG